MEQNQTILIVEDEALNRRLLRKILSETYTVLEAENGEVAWNIISKDNDTIDAVITDLSMPVMDGYALLEKIQQANLTELPVIAATASNDAETEQKVLNSGAWDYVTKPYNAKILLRRLSNALSRRQITYLERVEYLSSHDTLTGLYNRNRMFEETKNMLHHKLDSKYVFVCWDIDRFALYNTSFGEAEGDRLLKYFSQEIQKIVNLYPHHIYGRVGGDVFCACFAYDDAPETIVENVEHVQIGLTNYRKDYVIKMSSGIFFIDNFDMSIDDYYLRATAAAKNCKNQYEDYSCVFDSSMIQSHKDEIEIVNEMQQALDEEQFVIYFQAKVQLSTEKACGAEALVRWKHPEKGLISPGVFIPVFEKNGFIAKLDYYVWDHTCAILRKWIDSGKNPFPVSTNISRVSLYNPQLPEIIYGLVQKYHLAPSLLQLEITETSYMTNPDIMKTAIHRFHQYGFTILIDDFGSGYSSLNTLKEIEADILKIDMKFLPIDKDIEKGEVIIASVIKMANWLGMSVVTEGVETRRQRDFLEGAGCDTVQGFFYARPIPEKDFEEEYLSQTCIEEKTHGESSNEIKPKYNMTILVIDDSEEDTAILHEYFASEYHVHICSNAESGLAYLKTNKNHIKLVLLDNIMPGMSGLDFLRYVHRDINLEAIPVIMITASDTPDNQAEALENGAYDYITKPLIQQVVKARVAHVMELVRRTSVWDIYGQRKNDESDLDPFTGLLNKQAFRSLSTTAIETLMNYESALLVIDIDDFKGINDTYGHLKGDEVITTVSNILKSTYRKTDILGRFGGDEFVVLMTNIPSRDFAKRKASELIKLVILECAQKLSVDASVSIGISYYESEDTMDTIFARADQALYDAKKNGKSKSAVYGEKLVPVGNDDKPVILICGEDPQTYPTIALAYGNDASFANITSLKELKSCFEKYDGRIIEVCLDMQKRVLADSTEFYNVIVEHGGGKTIPIIALCKDGSMDQIRAAMSLDISNLILLPTHIDTIQFRMNQAILELKKEKE